MPLAFGALLEFRAGWSRGFHRRLSRVAQHEMPWTPILIFNTFPMVSPARGRSQHDASEARARGANKETPYY